MYIIIIVGMFIIIKMWKDLNIYVENIWFMSNNILFNFEKESYYIW